MQSRMRRPVPLRPAGPVVALLGALLGIAAIAFWFEHHAGAFSGPSQFGLTVVARHEDGQIRFATYANVGTLWARPGAARAISTLLVTTWRTQTGETALWQIEAPTPQQNPVIYGRVPAGFVQMMPGTGGPPALRPDEDYVVAVRGPGGIGRTRFSVRPARRATRRAGTT